MVPQFAKLLIILGIILIAIGLVFLLANKVHWIGRLPGDIYIQKKGFSFYFPLSTSILISLIATLILFFLRRR